MKIGLLEIVAIVLIILTILVITRMVRVKPGVTVQGREPKTDIVSGRVTERPAGIQNYLKRLGIVFIVAGLLFALTGISMLRWEVRVSEWALIAMVIGFAMLYLSRKK